MDSAFICFYKSHSLQPTQILWSSHICVYLCTSCSNWKIWIYLKWFFFFFSCVLLLTYIDFSLGFFWKKFTLMTQFLSFERCNAYFENAFWKFYKSPLKIWFGSLHWCNNTVQVFRGFQPNLTPESDWISGQLPVFKCRKCSRNGFRFAATDLPGTSLPVWIQIDHIIFFHV